MKTLIHFRKSEYPVNIDLMFKLLILNVLLNTYLFNAEFSFPFLGFMTKVGEYVQLSFISISLMLLGVLLVLFHKYIRVASILFSLALFWVMMGCRPCYSDSRMYIFGLFFLVALYSKISGTVFFRLQVLILYFGAGLNKLLDIDWLTGQYIDNWMIHKLDSSSYKTIASLFPSLVFAKIISWGVILSELFMVICFMNRKLFKIGIVVGIVLHSFSVILMNGVFGSFVAAVLISYLAFIDWPDQIIVVIRRSKRSSFFKKVLVFIDPYQVIRVKIDDNISSTELFVGSKIYKGFKALQQFLMFSPIFYVSIVLFVVSPGFGFNWVKGAVLILVSFLFLPQVSKIIDGKTFNLKE